MPLGANLEGLVEESFAKSLNLPQRLKKKHTKPDTYPSYPFGLLDCHRQVSSII